MSRDIYIAIMVADAKGQGLRLTPDEVARFAGDEAIHRAALNGLEKADWPEHSMHAKPNWKTIDPRRSRDPANLSNIAPEDSR